VLSDWDLSQNVCDCSDEAVNQIGIACNEACDRLFGLGPFWTYY